MTTAVTTTETIAEPADRQIAADAEMLSAQLAALRVPLPPGADNGSRSGASGAADPNLTSDETLTGRIRLELHAAQLLYGDATAEPLELVDDAGQRTPAARLPWFDGTTLERHVQAEHPTGMPLDEGLTVLRAVAEQLATLHEHRLVHRCPSPDHVIIPPEGPSTATLIGLGNVAERQQRPLPGRALVDSRYAAPELARELSGAFIHPRGDVYAFGALMAFVFSGMPPTETPEAPVSVSAWQRMSRLPDGVRILIAHCMQPFHKSRLIDARALLPLLTAESLPTRETPGFGAIYLLAPWTGAEDGARVGDLSPGPLVSRPSEDAATREARNTTPGGEAGADATPASRQANEAGVAMAPEQAAPAHAAPEPGRRPRWLFPLLMGIWIVAVVAAIARFI